MVVGGCPERSPDHVERTVAMGLSMIAELRRFAAERGLSLALRAGIHTGPVVAGVIGTRRFSFVKGKGEMLTFLLGEPG